LQIKQLKLLDYSWFIMTGLTSRTENALGDYIALHNINTMLNLPRRLGSARAKDEDLQSAAPQNKGSSVMTTMEIPEAFREFVGKSSVQLREGCDKIRAGAEEATDLLIDSHTTWSRGVLNFNLKAIDAARANSNGTFDLLSKLVSAKSYSESMELWAAYLRKQFDVIAAQIKDLAAQAQKVVSETVEPIKDEFAESLRKAA
jgi:phasin